jgi:very-short-patch-repair endonuclease
MPKPILPDTSASVNNNPDAQRFVAEQAERALQWGTQAWGDNVRRFMLGYFLPYHAAKLESPLEAIFYLWWVVAASVNGWEGELGVKPQHEVEVGGNRYRLDFAVIWPHANNKVIAPLIAVELDGHDFHERTKDQVIRRNQRDRELQAAGWTVLHFSGSELVKEPWKCVAEVHDRAMDLLYEEMERECNARR